MEDIFVALNSILSHKMRSMLTMLGIIIGIGAIIAIFSIIEGNTENTKRQLIGGNNNTIKVVYDKKSAIDPTIPEKSQAQKPSYIPFMGEDVLSKIKEISGVKNALLTYGTDEKIYYLSQKSSGKIQAVSQTAADIKQQRLLEGEGFDSEAFKNQEQVTYLEKSLYDSLFPKGDGIGKYVEVLGNPFKVIGVFESTEQSGLTAGAEKVAYIPLQQWHRIFDTINVSPEVTVQTHKADDLKKVAKKVSDYLNQQMPPSDYMFGVLNLQEFERQLDNLNKSNFVLLAGIASISLLVGGIGIRKALGARRKIILKQFLIEAVILTLMGGIIGVVAGIASGFAITQSLAYPYILSLFSVFVSLLFCCIIGVVFGLLPAVKASKLDPIEALRFE